MARIFGRELTLAGVARWLAIGCVVTSLSGWASGWLGQWSWPFELPSHFPLHQAAVLAGLAVVLLRSRRRQLASLALLVAAVQVGVAMPRGPSARSSSAVPRTLRIASLNVLIKSHHAEEVRAWLEAQQPDVILLFEVNRRWARDLWPLRERWPNVVTEIRGDSSGMMAFSVLPIAKHELIPLDDSERATIRLDLETPDGPLTVVLLHPPPPTRPGLMRQGHVELDALAKVVPRLPKPLVIAGDFNATPWCPPFRGLLRETGLVDSRRGFGLQATWPSPLGPFGIPIDHALVSDDVQVLDRRVGRFVYSDHLGIVLDLKLNAPPSS